MNSASPSTRQAAAMRDRAAVPSSPASSNGWGRSWSATWNRLPEAPVAKTGGIATPPKPSPAMRASSGPQSRRGPSIRGWR